MKNKLVSSIFVSLILCFALILSGCGQTPIFYEVTTQIHGASHGVVKGGGNFENGKTAVVSVTEHPNHQFLCWLHENKVVSTQKEYSFNVNEQTFGNYTAVFNETYCEFISLETFSFFNGVPVAGENVATINNVSLSFGHNQNELVEVYSCSEDDFEEQTVSKETIYAEDSMPYAFDKTKTIYIEISVTYLWNEIEYISTDVISTSAVSVESQKTIVLNKTLPKAVNLANQNLQLGGSEYSLISISLNGLNTFELAQNEEEAE